MLLCNIALISLKAVRTGNFFQHLSVGHVNFFVISTPDYANTEWAHCQCQVAFLNIKLIKLKYPFRACAKDEAPKGVDIR